MSGITCRLVALPTFFAFTLLSASAFAIAPRELQISKDVAAPEQGRSVMRPKIAVEQNSIASFSDFKIKKDSVSLKPLLITGQLGLDLNTVFGSQSAYQAWGVSAFKNTANRKQIADLVDAHIRTFAAEHASEFGFDARQLVRDDSTFFTDGDTLLVGYRFAVRGVPVKGSFVSFRFVQGQLVQVLARTFGAPTAADLISGTENALNNSEALVSAKNILGPTATLGAAPALNIIVPTTVTDGAGSRYVYSRAWQYEAVSATGELFRIVLSASTGKVIEWFSMHMQYTGTVTGVVNKRGPMQEKMLAPMPYVSVKVGGSIFGGGKTYVADQNGMLTVPNKKEVKLTLSSNSFKVSNSAGKSAALTATGDAKFDDATGIATLAESSTFYHLAVVQDWAKEIINPDWFKKQVTANVNIKDVCNAYWDGTTVNFFQAGRKEKNGKVYECNNTGEISDVVYHEWGHGLDAAIGGIDDSSYSEGIGDITSMMITDSNEVGPGFFKDGRPVRNMEGEFMYPPKGDEVEPHREGQIIGSTWYHLVQAFKLKYGADVGRATAKRYFLKSLYTTNQYTDVYDAVLTLDANGQSPESGPNYCLINKVFARHGLAQKASTCSE